MPELNVAEIADRYGRDPAAVISVLQDVQEAYYYLPEAALREVSEVLQVPLSRIYSLVTFYNALSLKPRGKYPVTVCLGTACHVRGGQRVMDRLQRALGLAAEETSEDGRFSLHEVRCVGCCGLAPVVTVGGDIRGHMTSTKIPKLLREYS